MTLLAAAQKIRGAANQARDEQQNTWTVQTQIWPRVRAEIMPALLAAQKKLGRRCPSSVTDPDYVPVRTLEDMWRLADALEAVARYSLRETVQ